MSQIAGSAAPPPAPTLGPALDRRAALKLMAASLALPVAACAAPAGEIVPYARTPERLVPGLPLTFATTLPLLGYAAGVLAISHEGRPIKIEGAPEHPANLGATDLFSQASTLSLYDPDRSRATRRAFEISTFEALAEALRARSQTWAANGGAGLHILTPTVTSPLFAEQIARLRQTYPKLSWRRWEPINRDRSRAGARLAFGKPLDPLPRFDKAKVIVALDADFLGPGPDQVRNARQFAATRLARKGQPAPQTQFALEGQTAAFSRLYCVEPSLTATGACADHRLAMRRSGLGAVAAALAAALGASTPEPALSPAAKAFVAAMAQDLKTSHGRAIVVVGEAQPAEIHALGHWLNHAIGAFGATLDLIEPVESEPASHSESIRALADDLAKNAVDTLLIIDGAPVYDAPADLNFPELLKLAPLSIRLSPYFDETAQASRWSVPGLHPLEDWGDARGSDGTTSLIQPLITPLYGGHSVFELLAVLTGDAATPYDLLRAMWRDKSRASDFGTWWTQTLQNGFISGLPEFQARVFRPDAPPPVPGPAPTPVGDTELTFHPDPSLWDGRFANNAWLQETPRPVTKVVWGNTALISSADAQRLGVASGDVLRISSGGASIEIPALISPGQADGSVAVTLGYGRTWGSVGEGVGVNVYPLRTLASPWAVGVRVEKTGRRRVIPSTQGHHTMDGRDIVRTMTLARFAALKSKPDSPPPVSLYAESSSAGPYQWAMVIDQTLCIGCNACVTACQAENNTPVVGPEEVVRGREMHWLRIDAYVPEGRPSSLASFQPVPCMHCEKAPCEPVCPVEASVHDGEGLNVQVYNRCFGTRFCQANCPYKVRRFNYYAYASGQEFANLGAPVMEAVRNPDVTVRSRGVMEKCTYCVQRISRGRRTAKLEGREIKTGEVVPACAAACPTRTIVFGNLSNKADPVLALREQPHEYALLGELGTRPRTTYLARVTNPGEAGDGS